MGVKHQEISEPHIFAAGLSEDEVFEWMDGKVSAIRRLKSALAERESIKQALEEVESRILKLTSSAAL